MISIYRRYATIYNINNDKYTRYTNMDTIYYKTLFKEHDEIGCGILEKELYVHTSIDLPLMWD